MDTGINSNNLPLKIGLLLVALTWFFFTFGEFTQAVLYNASSQSGFWLLFTETAGVIGLAFRTTVGFVAIITILLYFFKRDLSRPEAIMSLRWILLGEAIYWLSFLPSGVWGMLSITSISSVSFNLGWLIEMGIPCMVGSILIPMVLIKLFLELNPRKTARGAIKWGLISGTTYIFVLWLNNASNWIYAVMVKGTGYISNYPLNLLSFILTTIGLLLLTLYSAYFSKKSLGINNLRKLDFKRVGAIITALGLYFVAIYIMWIFFGSVGGWGAWYQWFLGHNMDLWILSLPLVGVPLLFIENDRP